MATRRRRLTEYVHILHPARGWPGADSPGGPELPASGPVSDWPAIRCTLDSPLWPDFVGCSGSTSYDLVFSARFQQLLASLVSGHDVLQWLPIHLANSTREPRPYSILHFPEPLDAIHPKHTFFVPDTDFVIKPAFRREVLTGHHIFTYPGNATSFYVARHVAEAALDAGMTGFALGEVTIV